MKSVIILLFTMLYSLASHSAVMKYLEKTSIFTDNDNSRTEWVHLDQTAGFSYNAVSNELESGGMYEGYRYAEFSEIDYLASTLFNLDISIRYPDQNEIDGYTDTLASFFGYSGFKTTEAWIAGKQYFLDLEYVYGLYGGNWEENSGFDSNFFGYADINGHPQYDYIDGRGIGSRSKKSSSYRIGSFLVRDLAPVPVPEPSTLALLGLGILGFGFTIRKNRK